MPHEVQAELFFHDRRQEGHPILIQPENGPPGDQEVKEANLLPLERRSEGHLHQRKRLSHHQSQQKIHHQR